MEMYDKKFNRKKIIYVLCDLDDLMQTRINCRFVKERGYLPVCPSLYSDVYTFDNCKNMEDYNQLAYVLLAKSSEVWVFGTMAANMRHSLDCAFKRHLTIKFMENVREVEE